MNFQIDSKLNRLMRMKKSTMNRCSEFIHHFNGTKQRHRVVIVTLTYRPGVVWSSSHLREWARLVRAYFRTHGEDFCYSWVAELTKAGIVHYHALVWVPYSLGRLPKSDSRGWWPHGSTETAKARKAVGYICKYISKARTGNFDFPRGLRLHGGGSSVKAVRDTVTYRGLPAYVRGMWPECDLPRRYKAGGYWSKITGLWLPSLYGFVCRCEGSVFVELLPQRVQEWVNAGALHLGEFCYVENHA